MKKKIIVIGIISVFLLTGFVSSASAYREYTGIVINLDPYPEEDNDEDYNMTAFSLFGIITSDGKIVEPCIMKNIKLAGLTSLGWQLFTFAPRLYLNAFLQRIVGLDVHIILPVYIFSSFIYE
jgi:hypothetical protein